MADIMRWLPPLVRPLHTERLALRAHQPNDAAARARLLTDPNVQRYFHGPLDLATARRRANAAPPGAPGRFTVALRNTDAAVGFVTLSPEKRTGDLGISYAFLHEHWGHGYAREAVPAILTWTFNHVPATQLPRIVAVTAPANQRSRHLLDAIGMIHIDTIDEEPRAALIYAINHPHSSPDTRTRPR